MKPNPIRRKLRPQRKAAFLAAYARNPLNFIPAGLTSNFQRLARSQAEMERSGRNYLRMRHERGIPYPSGYIAP